MSRNLLYNYITDIEELEKEGEKHLKYEESVIFVVADLNEHLEERKEESLAISNRDKWRAKPIVRESAKSNETGKYLQDQEEDLLQNVQSLDISQKEISVQNQQRQKESYPDDWIDRYASGQDQLNTSNAERGYQGSVQLVSNSSLTCQNINSHLIT